MVQSSFHFLLRSTWRAENVELNMMFVNFPVEKIIMCMKCVFFGGEGEYQGDVVS